MIQIQHGRVTNQSRRWQNGASRPAVPRRLRDQARAVRNSSGVNICLWRRQIPRPILPEAMPARSSQHQAHIARWTAPNIVRDVVTSAGAPLSTASRRSFESQWGYDFSRVRVHDDPKAARSADAVNAQAYTVGEHVVFARGCYSPHTSHGRSLLAHELAHSVQQQHASIPPTLQIGAPDAEGEHAAQSASTTTSTMKPGPALTTALVQRQTASSTPHSRFNEALASSNWTDAARALSELSDSDARDGLRALNSSTRESLRDGALALSPQARDRCVANIEAVERETPAPSAASLPARSAAGTDIASLPASEKLARAFAYAGPELSTEARAQLAQLFSPRSLAITTGFVVAYIAAQLTPVGWVADAIALASLTVAAIFIGRVLFSIVQDLYRFFSAVNATTDAELRTSGSALARAVVQGGLQIIILLITRGIARSRGGPPAPRTPPPQGSLALVTSEGLVVRVPAEAAASLPPGFALRGAPPAAPVELPPLVTRPSIPTPPPAPARPPPLGPPAQSPLGQGSLGRAAPLLVPTTPAAPRPEGSPETGSEAPTTPREPEPTRRTRTLVADSNIFMDRQNPGDAAPVAALLASPTTTLYVPDSAWNEVLSGDRFGTQRARLMRVPPVRANIVHDVDGTLTGIDPLALVVSRTFNRADMHIVQRAKEHPLPLVTVNSSMATQIAGVPARAAQWGMVPIERP